MTGVLQSHRDRMENYARSSRTSSLICSHRPPIEVQSQVTDPVQQLKAQRRWVVYRSVEDKAPLQPSGYAAKSDTSATWSTYDDCMSAVATGKFHGVGFVLTNSEYVGVDFDDVRDEDGIIDSVALSVAKSLDSYSEVSPSALAFIRSCTLLFLVVRRNSISRFTAAIVQSTSL